MKRILGTIGLLAAGIEIGRLLADRPQPEVPTVPGMVEYRRDLCGCAWIVVDMTSPIGVDAEDGEFGYLSTEKCVEHAPKHGDPEEAPVDPVGCDYCDGELRRKRGWQIVCDTCGYDYTALFEPGGDYHDAIDQIKEA